MNAAEALLRTLAAIACAQGAALSWQTSAGAHGAVSGEGGAQALNAAGFAANDFQAGSFFAEDVVAGLARDRHGLSVAAAMAPGYRPQYLLPPAVLAPGAGLCADDWGAAVVLGEDDALWAISPARKLVDALQHHEPASAGRELLLLGRARRVVFSFASLTPAGEFFWGASDGELPRAWAGDGLPPRQARAEKR